MNSNGLFISAKGRIGRGAFWIGWLALVGLAALGKWTPLIGWMLWAPTFHGFVCVSSKRLHDMGVSGWLTLIPIIATIGALVGLFGGALEFVSIGGAGPFTLGGIVSAIIAIAFLAWMGITIGEEGDNSYGPQPAPVSFS